MTATTRGETTVLELTETEAATVMDALKAHARHFENNAEGSAHYGDAAAAVSWQTSARTVTQMASQIGVSLGYENPKGTNDAR